MSSGDMELTEVSEMAERSRKEKKGILRGSEKTKEGPGGHLLPTLLSLSGKEG